MHMFQNHYPQRLFRMYSINAPTLFNATYAMLSPFLSPLTKSKIHFLTTGTPAFTEVTDILLRFSDLHSSSHVLTLPSVTHPTLQTVGELFDVSQLPVSCGGNDSSPIDIAAYMACHNPPTNPQ